MGLKQHAKSLPLMYFHSTQRLPTELTREPTSRKRTTVSVHLCMCVYVCMCVCE